MRQINYMIGTLPIIMLLGLGSIRAESQNISVVVNHQPLALNGVSPIQRNGAVLVPLRSVFEALGATVTYNDSSKTIVGTKGAATVSLAVGSDTATVNGQPQSLSQPAVVVDGSTLVPLRFVAESLGAYVSWDESRSCVDIQTPDAHLSTLPPPAAVSSSANVRSRVVGQLTGVYTNAVPEQITLRVNGQNTSVPISSTTAVSIRSNGFPGVSADISALQIGDQVRVRLAADGSALSIEAVYGEIIGTVKAIQQQADGSYVVSLNDGTTVQMTSNADVTMAGRTIQFGDIMASERVKIRTDQANKIGYSLQVVTDEQNGNGGSEDQPAQSSSNLPDTANEYPAPGASISIARPVIYALINNVSNTGIDPASLRINFDGEDVTRLAMVTPHFVTYQPAATLAFGRHDVDYHAVDLAGNVVDQHWSFSSTPQHDVISFTSDRPGKLVVLKPGDKMALTLTALPGGSAFVTLGSLSQTLTETTPGVYVGDISGVAGTNTQDATLVAHYTGPDHANLTTDLSQVVCIDGGVPMPPMIQTPSQGEQIGKAIRVQGLSAPGSTVNVTVAYSTKALGMFSINGMAAQTQTVADTDGHWETDSMPLSAPSSIAEGHCTDMTIIAVTVNATGQQSPSSSIKVLY